MQLFPYYRKSHAGFSMTLPENLLSDCDLLSAFAPAGGKNLSAACGAHSGSEAMYLCALSFLGLICHFSHICILLKMMSLQLPISGTAAESFIV
jgi:hypothetical protein